MFVFCIQDICNILSARLLLGFLCTILHKQFGQQLQSHMKVYMVLFNMQQNVMQISKRGSVTENKTCPGDM